MNFRRFLLAPLLVFIAPLGAWAVPVCHVIGPTSTGTGTGADFNNIKALSSQSTTGWERGDTYYFVAGNYNTSLGLDTASGGTTVISILRATNTDHGTTFTPSCDAGYDDAAMGQPAGPAIFPSAHTSTRYWIVDGAYHPSSWETNGATTGGYGFFIDNSNNCKSLTCWVFSISNSEDGSFITVKNLEMNGHGRAGIIPTPVHVDDFIRAVYSGTNLTFKYLYLHDSSSTFFKLRGYASVTIDHVWMARNAASPAAHSEALSLQSTDNLTISFSIFQQTEGTAAVVWLNAGGPTTSSNINISGNLFYDGNGWGNGVLSCINGNGINGLRFFNNTIANTKKGLSTRLQFADDAADCGLGVIEVVARNNLWYNTVDSSHFGPITLSNNSYLKSPTNDRGSSVTIVPRAPNPFVNSVGAVPTDFKLNSNKNVTPWFNTKAVMPATATDLLGTTRALSRGALEFVTR
jgi:hypothetical protein